MQLETIPDRSRPDCCATCTHWTLRLVRYPHMVLVHEPYCPLLDRVLRGNLTARRCDGWRREAIETDAVQLYAELSDPSR